VAAIETKYGRRGNEETQEHFSRVPQKQRNNSGPTRFCGVSSPILSLFSPCCGFH
jgi:hypothetical protein